MLGKNIGTKVDARFMSAQYKAYLSQGDKKKTDLVPARAPTKKLKGKAQKRAEMRRKGIFVQADSSEFDNTIMEKPSSRVRPYVLRAKNRKLRWKQHLQKIVGIPMSEESSASVSSSAGKSGEKSEKTLDASTTQSTIEESRKPKKKKPKKKKVLEVKEKQPQKVRFNEKDERTTRLPPTNWEGFIPSEKVRFNEKDERTTRLPPTNWEGFIPSEKVRFNEKDERTTRLPPTNWEGFIPSEKATSVSVKKQASRTTMLEDVFAPLEEDVDLTKILVDFNAENMADVGAGDKRFLKAANKILRTAYRDKAFEKTLTKAENDVLAKFFSGKIPYDAYVLHTLDTVLDKTIDYFRENKTKISPEVEEIIAKREALKAAMLETMLTVPRFLPSDWVKQFEVYQQEALRETSGINWARIVLFYPKYRTFEDGEADIFGNFTPA
ncbi:unnamed protein product [Cylicocyclus nassatus]|uniref:Uncharacterized protein n=1 Tax=Cylicocyclus nassatus TaxID=53992 RepID=A0AA36DST5_CYLNA|nr:unnamed protein product [Cylicocyclus nassatus]